MTKATAQVKACMPTERPDKLGVSCTIKSKKRADLALAELAWLEAEQNRIKAILEQRQAELQAELEPMKSIDIGSKRFTIEERIQQLREAINEWANEHLAEELPENSKSLSFGFGVIKVKPLPLKTENYEGWTDDQILVAIDAEMKFIDQIRKIEEQKFEELVVSDFVRISTAINRARLLELLREKKVTSETLGQFGIAVREGAEEIEVKPKAYA